MLDIDVTKAVNAFLDRFGVPDNPVAARDWLVKLGQDMVRPVIREALDRKVVIDLSPKE